MERKGFFLHFFLVIFYFEQRQKYFFTFFRTKKIIPTQKILNLSNYPYSILFFLHHRLGKPGVDAHVRHDGDPPSAVVLIRFLVNDGQLVTATADDTIHLWNFKQKSPVIVQSLKFQRERITFLHLAVGSKWLYVGTEKGNIHVVNTEIFSLSGHITNWNKTIDL